MKAARDRRVTGSLSKLTLVFAWILLTPMDARAYLDPGTGSIIITAILSVITGTTLVLKNYWRRIRALFGNSPVETDEPVEPEGGS